MEGVRENTHSQFIPRINHVVKMWSSTSLRTDVFAATREGKIVDKIRNVSLVRE
jgi:hypothetical protein